MKVFIFFLLLFSSQAFARDCLQEAWNYHLGMKLTYSINDLMDRYAAQKESLEICDEKLKNEMMDSEIDAMVQGLYDLRKEMTNRGDIPSDIIDFGVSSENRYVAQKELCVRLDEKIIEEDYCYIPREYLLKIKNTDYSNTKFSEICKENLPYLYKRYKGCRNKTLK